MFLIIPLYINFFFNFNAHNYNSMKKVLIIATGLALMSCSQKKDTPQSDTDVSSAIEGVSNLTKIGNAADGIQKRADELKAMQPASNENFKAVLPESLAGFKRTEISVGEMSTMNLYSAEAKYGEANKDIKVNIIDGAGEAGSSLYSLLKMALVADTEKTTENSIEKTMTINGTKVTASQHKDGEMINSEIKYIAKDRYSVTISGNGYTLEEISKIVPEINLNNLP